VKIAEGAEQDKENQGEGKAQKNVQFGTIFVRQGPLCGSRQWFLAGADLVTVQPFEIVIEKGHGGLSQNRKRRAIGKYCADKGQRRRAARFHGYLHAEVYPQIPLQPSARLTHGLKLATELWLLRCSVLRETPMASAIHFKRPNCYQIFKSGFLWHFKTFSKAEANAVVHVVKKHGLEAIEPHPKPLCKTIKVQFFTGTKKLVGKGKLLEVGPEGSQGFQAWGQGLNGSGHLDAPYLFPRGGLVKDGRRNLTACQGFLDVPGCGIRKKIEPESDVGIVNRGGPCHILEGCGKGHGVLFPDEFFSQFPEVFLSWGGCFGFHEFIAD
jgi:hypothetical protein